MNIFKKLYKMLFGPDEGWYGKKENKIPSHTVSSKPHTVNNVVPAVRPSQGLIGLQSSGPISTSPTGVQPPTGNFAVPYRVTGNQGITGLIGLTGGSARYPLIGVTGFSGSTGLSPGPTISEDEWETPVKSVEGGVTRYLVKGLPHCAFGPAVTLRDKSTYWFIKGRIIDDKNVAIMKSILEDIKLAPLYLNDILFKYTARWVLKNFRDNPE